MEQRGPCVLLVGDEESIRRVLNIIPPPARYTLYQVRDGKEALRRIHSIRPDLILLDPGLPDIDGKEEVIRHLRGRVNPRHLRRRLNADPLSFPPATPHPGRDHSNDCAKNHSI